MERLSKRDGDINRSREREDGEDIDSCPNRAAFLDIRATAAPQQPDKTPAEISNSISNKQQPRTNTFPASHRPLTNHCQTAQGHLTR